jgi:precorrin-3B synthase
MFVSASPVDACCIVNLAARKGWCPGVLRPMETGDGLLVRLRLTGGVLSTERAQAIAACAIRYGNGLIDLSSRANFQLRGVTPTTLQDLTSELQNLGILDETPEAEAVRNVIASPLAGIDPDAALDIRPVVQALEAELTDNSSLHRLPGKFGFLIDDGGHITLSQVRADVRFEALVTSQGPRFLIRLGDSGEVCMGDCASDQVPDCAARIAQAFLRVRCGTDVPRRMGELVGNAAFASFAEAAGFQLDGRALGPPRPFDMTRVVGHGRAGAMHYVGAAMPFGRLSGEALAHLASVAARSGATELRLTPWRAIIVADISACDAGSLVTVLGAARFIVDAHDPRLYVAACPGAPACHCATTSVQEDAERFAGLLPQLGPEGQKSLMLHVSGCAKGCAHASPTPFTLVGNAGRYDLVVNGTARGAAVVTGLSDNEVQTELAQRIERHLEERAFAKLA